MTLQDETGDNLDIGGFAEGDGGEHDGKDQMIRECTNAEDARYRSRSKDPSYLISTYDWVEPSDE